jgi:hypothetical protein
VSSPSEPLDWRGSILIVGPDGTGKSTGAEALCDALQAAGVRVTRAHFRPGLLPPRSRDSSSTRPHDQHPRSVPVSAAKALHAWVDHLAAWITTWSAARRTGALVVERGFPDQIVDPIRYRLSARSRPLLYALSLLLPRFDVVVLMTGDPEVIAQRKGELDGAETSRQLNAWWRMAGRLGKQIATVDTTSETVDAIISKLRALTVSSSAKWYAGRLLPHRLRLASSAPDAPALAIYRPSSTLGQVRLAASRALPPVRAQRPELPTRSEIAAWLKEPVGDVAAMNSSAIGRWIVGVDDGRTLQTVLKIGLAMDEGLKNEAEILSQFNDPAIRTPELVRFDTFGGGLAVATRAFPPQKRMPSLDDALEVALALRLSSRPLVHGDLAPWNFVALDGEPRWALIDFENARFATEPLFDLAHFVIRSGELLGSWSPQRAVDLLCSEGQPGVVLLQKGGDTDREPRHLLLDYLARSAPANSRYRQSIHEAVA